MSNPEATHYSDVIMGTIASQITSLTLFTQPFIQTQIKENIKAPRHWLLCGEFTGDWWIPRTNGQLRGKCFRLMTSSWCSYRQHKLHKKDICCNIRQIITCNIQRCKKYEARKIDPRGTPHLTSIRSNETSACVWFREIIHKPWNLAFFLELHNGAVFTSNIHPSGHMT